MSDPSVYYLAAIELAEHQARGEDVSDAIEQLAEMARRGGDPSRFAESDWVQERAPHGHSTRRWVNRRTGNVVYSDKRPGSEHGHAAPAPAQPTAPLASSRLGPRTLEVLRAVAAVPGHVEHLASAYVQDKVARAVAKLPPRAQRVVVGAWGWTRAGVGVLFTNWRIGQALAERVARKRGLSEEEARKLRGTLSTYDQKTFEVFKVSALVGLHAAHLPAVITGTVPIASAGYLAYSAAEDPGATLRAAAELTKETIAAGLARLPGTAGPAAAKALLRPSAAAPRPTIKPGLEGLPSRFAEDDPLGNVDALANALTARGFSDWFLALLSVAADQTGNLQDALTLAGRVAAMHPNDVASRRPDDADWLDRYLQSGAE